MTDCKQGGNEKPQTGGKRVGRRNEGPKKLPTGSKGAGRGGGGVIWSKIEGACGLAFKVGKGVREHLVLILTISLGNRGDTAHLELSYLFKWRKSRQKKVFLLSLGGKEGRSIKKGGSEQKKS